MANYINSCVGLSDDSRIDCCRVFLKCLLFPDIAKDQNNLNPWMWLLYAAATITSITVFYSLTDANKYRLVVYVLACLHMSSSLTFLICFLHSVCENGDGNVLVTSVLLVSIAINLVLLLGLIRGKRLNADG